MHTFITQSSITEHFPQFALSFRPFVKYLKEQQLSASSAVVGDFYNYLLKQFEEAAADAESLVAPESSDRLHELFQLATVAVLPLVDNDPNIPYAFCPPVPVHSYYLSPGFEKLIKYFPDLSAKPHQPGNWPKKEQFLYRLILEKCYSVTLPLIDKPSFHFEQQVEGLTKYYQMEVNISFAEPRITGPLPKLQPAWIEFAATGKPISTDVEPMPLHDFVLEGFSFFRLRDVTEEESLRQLREVFVHLSTGTESSLYQQFETAFRNLCGLPGLEVGILALPQVNGRYVYLPDSQERSVFLRLTGTRLDDMEDTEPRRIMEDLLRHPQPKIFEGLEGIPDGECQSLAAKGIQSFLMYPIREGNRVLGSLEMASPLAKAFMQPVLDQIERTLPLMRELLHHQLHEFRDSLEQRIKTRFTSIQPAVKWKFYEVAWEEMRREQSGAEKSLHATVRFAEVYPFYGAVDVRSSSSGRQKAIQRDLDSQLLAVENLLQEMDDSSDPECIQSLMQTTTGWRNQLPDGPTPDQEQGILQFLIDSVHPFFQGLLSLDKHSQLLQEYFSRINSKRGQFSEALQAYEQTMNRLNSTINNYIDQQETSLQTLFPHYFERYRTDGAEYTLYVGQAMAPATPFHEDVLHRLYHWQVESMIEVAQLTHQLRPELPLPLKTTQLILSHNHPVDISFRRDERRFDVEGSYSIRYEVLKKRIDKVRILDTKERLTQPDTIALVYSQSSEVEHYLPAINSLQAAGKLQKGIDYLDLEPVQGVANLKALRLRIAYANG